MSSDPNYILSQEEFHAAIRPLCQMHGETQGQVTRQINGLRTTGGWLFVSIGLWALLIGFGILAGWEKGRQ